MITPAATQPTTIPAIATPLIPELEEFEDAAALVSVNEDEVVAIKRVS
jgi:hypothetical protein